MAAADGTSARLTSAIRRRLRAGILSSKIAIKTIIYPQPNQASTLAEEPPSRADDLSVIQESDLFDGDWYRRRYPDVAKDGGDPAQHYLTFGGAEGRNPGPKFDSHAYWENNPDVAAARINPLLHFVKYGRNEGRSAIRNDYRSWIEQFDTLTDADRDVFRAAIGEFPVMPLISVVIPVYNTDRIWLERAIDSVRAQLYPNWELCISDDASTKPEVRQTLNAYAKRDSRIRVVYRETNGHIVANSNSALRLATGDYVALLDDDDELPEHALFWVAREIVRHPDVDLIYSDEDKIDTGGHRYDAYFKPDWNPALILAQNVFSHLGVYRRSLLEQIGGFQAGFEGSQDHDLLLRCTDLSAPDRIRHIPRVLYHWRARPGSTASSDGIAAKPYAWQAGARAVQEHLQRRGIAASVKTALQQFYQVDYAPSGPLPKVTVVIPSTGKPHPLQLCLQSLLERSTYPDFEVVIAVNQTSIAAEESGRFLAAQTDRRVRVLAYEDQPFNYSRVNNWAVRQARGSVLCFLNDDTEIITPNWLDKLVTRVQLDGVGAAGPMLYYPNDTIQHAGVILGLGGVARHPYANLPRGHGGYFGRAGCEQDLSCVTAACMVMRREVFESAGGFNEDLAVAFNDVDLCIRIRRTGWRIVWTPSVELYHHESTSVGRTADRKLQFDEEFEWMRRTWSETLDSDPFYSPNLSLDSNFALSYPPRLERLPSVAKPPDGAQSASDEVPLAPLSLIAPPEFDLAFYRRSNADLHEFSDQQLADHFARFGLEEGRPGSEAAMRHGLLELIPSTGLVLEIAPWFKPTVTGPRVRYFDVFDTNELRRRAKDVGANPDDCPDVHYISPVADLSIVPDTFGAVISAHVIEHQTDLVKHLNLVADLLEPGGFYFLIVPDRRYCFDYFMPSSTIADVLDAHIRKRTLHDPKSILEYRLLRTHNDPIRHWSGDHGTPLMDEDPSTIENAVHEASGYNKQYMDSHAWRFTPETFRALITALAKIKLINLEPLRVYNSVRGTCEFTAILRKP